MDPLQRYVAGPRAQGVFSLRVSMAPPWCVDVADHAPLTVVAMATGSAWLITDDQTAQLVPGAVALLSHGVRYRVADSPDRPPTVRIDPGQACVPFTDDVRSAPIRGVLEWGNTDGGPDQLLIGTYETHSLVGEHVTAPLPDVVVLQPGEVNSALLDLLAHELAHPGPGHSVVIDRLLDVIVCTAVRAAVRYGTTGWLTVNDEVVTRALDLMHTTPENPWTLEALAGELHVSRATLAARFRSEVGTPPGAYLTRWRLTLAADALAATPDGLETIARRVGYSSAFALSAAFKRHHGMSPAQYRRTAAEQQQEQVEALQ